MSRRLVKNQAGFTIVDFFLLAGIVVVLILIGYKTDDVYQASFREKCWHNQESLEIVLHDTLLENNLDTIHLLTAYTIFDPAHEMKYRLVLILNPVAMAYLDYLDQSKDKKPLESPPPFVVKDLTDTIYKSRALCPLRKGKEPKHPVVDYWRLPTHRWFCMHNDLHN